jgi:hypothetical protein
MSTNSAVLSPVESSAQSVEQLLNALRESGLPIVSAAVVRNLKGAELVGEYDDQAAEDGYTEDGIELAAPIGRGSITYLLIGLGGLESDYPPGISIVNWEGGKHS